MRLSNFRRFLSANILSKIGAQMVYLAVGWEVLESTHSMTALGIVGLFMSLPIFLFALPAGHLIDRFDRKKIVVVDQVMFGMSAFLLAGTSLWRGSIPDWAILHGANRFLFHAAGYFHETQQHFESPHIPVMLALLFMNCTVRAVNQPAKQALLPQLVPGPIFANAASWYSSTVEVSTMLGPTIAGFMLAMNGGRLDVYWPYAAVYATAGALQLVAGGIFSGTRPECGVRVREPVTVTSLVRGVTFVMHTRVIFATLMVDLFSVLLGGSVALLPVFASDILHCGSIGLGVMRAAPSVGAVTMAMILAHRPPMKRAGRAMLWAVAGFGAATVGFGLSGNIVLSCACLFAIGACDNVSTIVRQTLVQLLTPDSMRGRVSAVKAAFSSSADGLGSLESGITGALLGPRLAVVMGGVGTLIVAGVVSMVWPQMREFGSLEDARPEEDGGGAALDGVGGMVLAV